MAMRCGTTPRSQQRRPVLLQPAAPERVPGRQPGCVRRAAEEQPVRATGYYGLNVGVENGTVLFGGRLGMYNASGGSEVKTAASGTLDESKLGNGLFVSVKTLGGLQSISFDPQSVVTVSRFRHVPLQAPLAFTDVTTAADVAKFGVAPKLPFVVMRRGNLPSVPVRNGNPNAIGPGPNNVAAGAAFARLGELPEVVFGSPDQVRAAALHAGDSAVARPAEAGLATDEPAPAADLGRSNANGGAAQGVFDEARRSCCMRRSAPPMRRTRSTSRGASSSCRRCRSALRPHPDAAIPLATARTEESLDAFSIARWIAAAGLLAAAGAHAAEPPPRRSYASSRRCTPRWSGGSSSTRGTTA